MPGVPCAGEGSRGNRRPLGLAGQPCSKAEDGSPKGDTKAVLWPPHLIRNAAHFTCHYCQVIGAVHRYLCGAGEGSVVRALTALAEDPSTQMALTMPVTPVRGDPVPPLTSGLYMVHTYT